MSGSNQIRVLIAEFTRRAAPQAPEYEPLSEHEREVLRLLADGLSNREIAGQLVLAEGTVKVFHRVRFADQIDHVVSLYNFGKTEDNNHQPLCGECNLWKWTKNIDYRT